MVPPGSSAPCGATSGKVSFGTASTHRLPRSCGQHGPDVGAVSSAETPGRRARVTLLSRRTQAPVRAAVGRQEEQPVSLPPLVEPAADLSIDEVRRYSRHLIIPDVGMDGQKRLKNAKVLAVGAGGLGSPVLMYLA